MKKMLVGLMCAGALVGCGGGAEVTSPTSAVTESQERTIEKNATYSTVVDLKDMAVEAGYVCPSWEQTDHISLAAQSGSCSDKDVFSIYTTTAARDEIVDFLKTNSPGTSLLVGENWIVNSHDAASLAETLGGVVVTTGPA